MKFWAPSDMLSQPVVCLKKTTKKKTTNKKTLDHNSSLKWGSVSEEERYILAMYFITIIVPDAI